MITQKYLKECLHYDPESGIFTWLQRPGSHFHDERSSKIWNSRYSGKQAGSITKFGYVSIRLNKKARQAHRLAWIYVNGSSSSELDHIDGDKKNNKINNLREVSRIENGRNQKLRKNNSSGVMGVSKISSSNRFEAYIMTNRVKIHLGRFSSFLDAVAARKSAELKYGFHLNHGSR